MNGSGEKNSVVYFAVTIGVIVFVMLYVWQSIEVMKAKLEYKKLLRTQESLVKVNDRLLYGIERHKTMDTITKEASERGMRPVQPGEVETIDVK